MLKADGRMIEGLLEPLASCCRNLLGAVGACEVLPLGACWERSGLHAGLLGACWEPTGVCCKGLLGLLP